MRPYTCYLLLSLAVMPLSAQSAPSTDKSAESSTDVAVIYDAAYIESGDLLMFVNNEGSFAFDQYASLGKNDGLYYPGECPWTVMFASGLWIGAKVGNEIRVSTAEYAFDYLPGTITDGPPAPHDPRFRVYKIRRGDTRGISVDYAEWPFDDGAPSVKDHSGRDSLDADGYRIPLIIGDEVIWTVFNDADMAGHGSDPGSDSPGPLGIEAQLYAYAYDSVGDLGRIIFMQYTLINKSSNVLESTHVSFWADPDLGDPVDDFVGCDTILDLGYCYNAFNHDDVYGDAPPTVGFGLLTGPAIPSAGEVAWLPGQQEWIAGHRNLDMTSFSKYINGADPNVNFQTWNYMRGFDLAGSVVMNPVSGQPTKFMVSGNPVTHLGWLDNNAADRRFMVTSGPFTMLPGDTQEVAIAVMVGSSYPLDCFLSILADTIHAVHSAGTSAGHAFALVAKPDSTTGHDYQITFTGPVHDIRWHLWDRTIGTLLLTDQTDLQGEDDNAYADGLVVRVIGSRPGVGGWEIPNGTRRFTWVGANGFAFEGFNGAISWESPCHFFENCAEQGVPANHLRRVLLRLAATGDGSVDPSDANASYAYRYLRAASSSPARPEFAPYVTNPSSGYAFQSFEKSVALSAWDVDSDPPRRLALGFLENNVMYGLVDGKYWPPFSGAADNTAGSGPREWLWIFDADYSEASNPSFEVNALIEQLPVMYFMTVARRTGDPWESGDEFLIIPADSNLFFTEADTFDFTAPLPGGGPTAQSALASNLESITNLRHLDSVAQAKFEEEHMSCACPCFADPACSGSSETINAISIVGFIDVAFRSAPSVHDKPCPVERTDVDCTGATDIVDVVIAIDVTFRNGDPAIQFCDPCR